MIAGVTIMGILNVTPDSFSDGGKWSDPEAAIAHGLQMHSAGADLIDVGGESTRPGAEPVSIVEEQRRVVPVVRALTEAGVHVSVDTMNAETAQAATSAGAAVVNDVSGGLFDPDMLHVVAMSGARYVAMHWKGPLTVDPPAPHYDDVVAEVQAHLGERIEACVAAGIDKSRIILDPGLGFSKSAEHNWELLRAQRSLARMGYPVLIGASRKRFLTSLLAEQGFDAPTIELRDVATAALSLVAAQNEIWGVRVHNVEATVATLAVREHLTSMNGGNNGR